MCCFCMMFQQAFFLCSVSAGIVSMQCFSRDCFYVMFLWALFLYDVSAGICPMQ